MAHGEGSAVKVVGFIVNGESPNSAQTTPSTDVSLHSGSPLPVSIPPPFNRTPRGQPQPLSLAADRSKSSTAESILDPDPEPGSSELTRQMTPTQRTNKQSATTSKTKTEKKPTPKKSPPTKKSPEGKAKKEKGITETKNAPCISLFDHLEPFSSFSREDVMRQEDMASLDPTFLQFCVEYGERRLNESLACKALIQAFVRSLDTFQNEASLFYTREFLAFLNHRIGCVIVCRALNIAMRNSIRIIKVEVSKLKSGVPLEEGRDAVRRVLQSFLEERVDVAPFIAKEANELIKENDVIMTYSASETVLAVLSYAWFQQEKRFRVVVVDVRPECEGKGFLHRLCDLGIPCTYLFINALSFALKDVSKIMMGASAVLSNGTVVSRAGSASVALMAHQAHIPTVICCQTLKFHERVQLDSFTHNELGDAQELLSPNSALNPEHLFLSLLNVRYDLMPSAFVSMIVSELGFIPASSVPVILREQASEKEMPHI